MALGSGRLGFETAILVSIRLILILGCRKYVLRTVHSTLKTLSVPHKVHGSEVELGELPLPTTHTPKSAGFSANPIALHSKVSGTVFAWAFAECCMMFALLVLQGMNVFTPRTRLVNWKFSVLSLVGTILVIIPSCISFLLALGGKTESLSIKTSCGPRFLLNSLPIILYFIALSFIPLPEGLTSPDFTTKILSRLIVVGTVVLGLLSGVGAVNNSWTYLPFLAQRSTCPTDSEIQGAEYSLSSVRSDLVQKRKQLAKASSTESQGSWLSRVGTSLRGGDDLSQEIKGLESLEYQMAKNVESLKARKDSLAYGATWQGSIVNLAGRVFAVYCVTRILSCLYNLITLPSQRSKSTLNYSDLLSSALAYGFSHLSSSTIQLEDIASFSRQLSLVLVGLIIVTSVRYVLRGVARVLRISSRSLGASLMMLVLAQIMGIYLLSTVVQMRSSFPPPPEPTDGSQENAVNLFSTIPEYELFGSLFDWTFLLAAFMYALLRWAAEKMNAIGDDI
ncbi:hypothetical protein FA15DRAFT_674243 [Coprinopsis marcescibilis]|uniref:G protein-coupled receptor 89 n=1 Tax=Coprinopsis marcescibilis TaxID=230819 RepID=A0A5C3KIK4_COPMA|nr:hypothetical protein FA15DRAFT_674243 [Coprinopsis marcescibilis]